jgi:peptidoglycan hydrolase-like protein with peptidoglycan-binding domain
MSRLLFNGCPPGKDVEIVQNDLNLITEHPGQGSALAALTVDGIYGAKSQARVREFQGINGLKADGLVGAHTRDKLNELFLMEPRLQVKRIRGGVPGGIGGFGKKPAAGNDVVKNPGTPGGGGGWGKSGSSGVGTSKSTGVGGSGPGKTGFPYGYKG